MNRLILAACMLAILTVAVAQAAGMRRDFEWMRAIEGVEERGGFYKFSVDGEIFAGCQSFPDDLRIIDSGGAHFPFFLWTPREREELNRIDYEPLNLSSSTAAKPYLRQDLQVEPGADGVPPQHNRLRIESSGRDFLRRVELYGRDEGSDWALVGTGFLIDLARPAPVANRVIEYPRCNYRQLQLRIYADARAGLESFEIEKLELLNAARSPGRMEDVPLQSMDIPEPERSDDAQILLYDSGFEKRPIDKLVFEIAADSFARPVRVYGRDHTGADWRAAGAGEIHSLPGSSNKEIALHGFAQRYIKVEIFHYDDQELAVEALSAQAVCREIVFEALSANPPQLYYGAEFAKAPKFDIDRRVESAEIAELPRVSVAQARSNPEFRRPGFGSLGPWLAAAVIGLVSIAVIKVIIDMLHRSVPHAEE
jgi:hypothetical protein